MPRSGRSLCVGVLALGCLLGEPAAGQVYPVYVDAKLPLPDWANDVEIQGNLAYVAARTAGLRIIDVSDPANPTEIGALDTPGTAWDLEVVGSLAYVADGAPDAFVPSGSSGLRIIDVSDPTNPVEIGSVPTPSDAKKVRVVGNLAYVADGWDEGDAPSSEIGLRIFDVTDPTAPVEIGNLLGFSNVDGGHVVGSLVYGVAANPEPAFAIADASDPARPSLISLLNGVGGEDVAVVGSLAYTSGGGSLGYLGSVIDVTDPSNPVAKSAFEHGGRDIDVVGNIAYLAGLGVRVIDVSNPLAPFEVGALPDYPGPVYLNAVEVVSGLAFVATGNPGALRIHGFDLSAPACSDGLSNDGDAAIDDDDPNCSSPDDPTEYSECSDGIDNDGDGKIDFPEDPACLSPAGDLEGPVCDDGDDNDGDGLVDGADPGCFDLADLSEDFDCGDGLDNDGDGAVDGDDIDCPAPNHPRELPACSDGLDNDSDGFIDAADDGCAVPQDTGEATDRSLSAGQLVVVTDSSLVRIDPVTLDFQTLSTGSTALYDAALTPAGEFVALTIPCTEVVAIDPATGDSRVIASGLSLAIGVCGIDVDADGSILVNNGAELLRIDPSDGGTTVVATVGPFPAGGDVVVAPGGVIYGTTWNEIWRLEPGGSVPTTVAPWSNGWSPRISRTPEGLLRVAGEGSVVEVDPISGSVQPLALDTTCCLFLFTGIAVAADGRTWLNAEEDGYYYAGDDYGIVDLASPGGVPLRGTIGLSGEVIVVQPPCNDSFDNDADAAIDLDDPGCRYATSLRENPQCQDGVNNDAGQDALIDFDGGLSALGAAVTAPDPQCTVPWTTERNKCGLGVELALILAGLAQLHRRRRR